MLKVDIKKDLGAFKLNVSFKAHEGITGILGESGCGKSMTLKCIAGIEKPDEGKIVLDGITLFDSEKGINLPVQKRRVGYLFQNYAIFPNMTVEKNILCGLHNEKDKAKRNQELRDVVSLLRLDGLLKHKPHQLSGGQAQRVALARILVSKPNLLLLDEPFSALDFHLRDKLQIEMKKLLSAYEGSILMVTHSRDEAYRMSEKIALMQEGNIMALEPIKQLFADPGTVAGASMTGCKNIAPAVKTGEYEVEVPDWGIRLKTSDAVREDIVAVGIRAHYFGPKTNQNRFKIHKSDEMEEPFEWIIRFRYENQRDGSDDIWWRLPKEKKPQQMPEELGIAATNVLLLYPPDKNKKPLSIKT